MGPRCAIPVLMTVLVLSCASPAPEPASVLPRDAGALVVFAPAERIRASLTPILVRLPEAAGVVDLARSIAGIDLTDDAGTRDNGLDPRRGPALALWDDAVLVVLPLQDASVGLRRLRLRLARLGFVRDETGPTDRESFRSLDHAGRVAALGSAPGLAFVCIGTPKKCGDVPRGTGWDPRPVVEELAAGDPIVVGVIRNPTLVGFARDLGLPVREPGVGIALALLQDARWAVGLDQGVRLRVAAGPAGPAFAPTRQKAERAPGLAAAVSISLPPGMETTVARLLGARGPWDRWAGDAGVAVLSSGAAVSPLPADWTEVLRRVRWVAALRFRSLADAEAAALAANGVGGPGPEGSPVAAPGGTAALGGTLGVGLASRADGDVLFVGSEAGRPAVPHVDRETVLPERDGVTLLRVRSDPAALLDAIGGGRLEYLGHMVRALESVGATLTFQAGRWVLDLEARLQ